jgi:transketolase
MNKMRKEFGKWIVEMAKNDSKIVLLVGDVGYQVFDEYRRLFPERFLNLGICEQSIIGLASGMALEGLKPYVYTITPFLIERPFEQLKLDVDEQNTNVKLIGYADYPKQGATHRTLNEKGLMALFKNIKSYFPSNSDEARAFFQESYQSQAPSFISLRKNPENKKNE